MTSQEIFIVYGFPAMLVAVGILMAWRNHVVMSRAKNDDDKDKNRLSPSDDSALGVLHRQLDRHRA